MSLEVLISIAALAGPLGEIPCATLISSHESRRFGWTKMFFASLAGGEGRDLTAP